MRINDEILFKEINIERTSSFGEIIKTMANHVYESNVIQLDSNFNIEKWLENLLEFEAFLSITKKRHRDHLLHACRIALLGEKLLATQLFEGSEHNKIKFLDIIRELLMRNKTFCDKLEQYDITGIDDVNKVILQTWYVASLFHDIGYIYESFSESWNNILEFSSYPNFRQFCLNVESQIISFEKEFTVRSGYKKHITDDFFRGFDHGNISACLISNLLGESNLICDLAAMISDYHTSSEIIDFSQNPLSFLLVLLDEVQEWERPVMGRKLKDQVLSEEISKYSPYTEHECLDPELEEISIKFDSIIEKNNNITLNFNIILDYGCDPNTIDETNFSFPMMLYLKYKNLQRLRINKKMDDNGKKIDLLNDTFKVLLETDDLQRVEFKAAIVVSSGVPLEYIWNQQCNILLINSLKNNNNIIYNWLKTLVEHESEKLLVKFNITENNPPRKLNGDFKNTILKSHDMYIKDSYIKQKMIKLENTYEWAEDPEIINILVKVKQELLNTKKDANVYGIYTCFDENILEKPELLKLVIVDEDDDMISKADLIKLPREKPSEKEKYEEGHAMFIPFNIPLVHDDDEKIIKDIQYDFRVKSNIKNINQYDGIFNGRKSNKIMFAELRVKWDKRLFDTFFETCIVFKGNHYAVKEMLESIKTDSYKDKDAYRDVLEKKEKGKYYYFERTFADIEPYEIVGFAWKNRNCR